MMYYKAICFIQRQIRQIRRDKPLVILRKFIVLLQYIMAPIVVLIVRLLRPLVVIRFGPLISGRIGHYAVNTEVYICEREAGMHGSRAIDIFYHVTPICNRQLKKMWDRTLHVCSFAKELDKINRFFPGGSKHIIPYRPEQGRDIYGLLARTQPHLSFTLDEERQGEAALKELGIFHNAPFICFHSRDSAYLDTIFPDNNWRYHDYRDSDIKNFIPAVEELTRRGYFAVRIGSFIREPLKVINPIIIDYAKNNRTEFMDIFLGAKCSFYLGDPCGLGALPVVFRRPFAIANMIPFEYALTYLKNCILIPKKLWLKNEHRFLTFPEILNSGIGRFEKSEQFEKKGIEVLENTPEEILALAVEMDERLKGNWKDNKEDEELQQRFWAFFKPSELNQVFLSRVGTEFLRQNQELLK